MADTYETLSAMLGSSDQTFGRNGSDENVIVERYDDHILTTTFQRNGWVRSNHYYEDGTVEELFER